MQAMEISRTGLDVEWRRLDVIAENIANANSADSKSVSFKPLTLVSGPKGGFAAQLDAAGRQKPVDVSNLSGVTVYAIEAGSAPPRMVYEPGNPNADEHGFVGYPAIDQSQEMVRMIEASRAYEANIVAMNAEKEMYSKALTLGERS